MSSALLRKKILIVEDESDTRIFLCNLLGNCGYQPVDAGNREEGMQKAKQEKPALIILDVMMQKESGIQMYRELSQDDNLRHVPVIMVSNIDKKTFLFYQKLAGAPSEKGIPEPGAYLEKPLEAEDLLKVVHRLTAAAECFFDEDDQESG